MGHALARADIFATNVIWLDQIGSTLRYRAQPDSFPHRQTWPDTTLTKLFEPAFFDIPPLS